VIHPLAYNLNKYNGNRRKMDFVEYLKKKIVASQKDEL